MADDFFAAVERAAETTAKNIQRFPTEDPSFTKFMMIQPIFQNIDKQPLFGNPQPNSFVLYDWFEQHRPKNGGYQSDEPQFGCCVLSNIKTAIAERGYPVRYPT